VPAADGPDQRGVPLDQGVPRPLVTVPSPDDQVNDHRLIAYGASVFPRQYTGATAGVLTDIHGELLVIVS
jgi:hypothetical protein